ADDDAIRRRVDAPDVPGTGLVEIAKTAALTDRVQGGPAMRAQPASAGIDDGSFAHRQPRREVARGFASRHEADLLAFRFVGHRQPELTRVLTDLALGHATKGKHDA